MSDAEGYGSATASIVLDPAYRHVTVEEFLAMDFRGAKAELDDGIIFMMAGVSEEPARIARFRHARRDDQGDWVDGWMPAGGSPCWG